MNLLSHFKIIMNPLHILLCLTVSLAVRKFKYEIWQPRSDDENPAKDQVPNYNYGTDYIVSGYDYVEDFSVNGHDYVEDFSMNEHDYVTGTGNGEGYRFDDIIIPDGTEYAKDYSLYGVGVEVKQCY